jgi:hypothetical protein
MAVRDNTQTILKALPEPAGNARAEGPIPGSDCPIWSMPVSLPAVSSPPEEHRVVIAAQLHNQRPDVIGEFEMILGVQRAQVEQREEKNLPFAFVEPDAPNTAESHSKIAMRLSRSSMYESPWLSSRAPYRRVASARSWW